VHGKFTLTLVVFLTAQYAFAYEWWSHNRMAFNARQILLIKVASDPELRTFLQDEEHHGYGEDLDSRAGTPYDPWVFFGTDEDCLEAKISSSNGGDCFYDEIPCFMLCSIDHFSPPLPAPFAGQDALAHAHWYFEWAVRFYKAGICRPNQKAIFHRWAARALGHALHLVQDMGSPQHVGPENHAPIWAGGDGRSFHEQWTLGLWDVDTTKYTRWDGTTFPLGHFEQYAQVASVPFPGKLPSIMRSLAAEAENFPNLSPYPPGRQLPLLGLLGNVGLLQILAPSGMTDRDFHWVQMGGPPNGEDSLRWFTARMFPPYGQTLSSRYQRHLTECAYLQVGPMYPPAAGSIQIHSMNLAERLWGEPNGEIGDGNNPLTFDASLGLLLTHTTEATAGAILAFWDEVKGYECQCGDESPCSKQTPPVGVTDASARATPAHTAEAPSCPLRPPGPGPYPPGRDFPDDTQGVVGNVSAVKTTSVSQYDSVELGKHWPQIAAVGVEKALPSLVDFGRTMRLLVEAQDETLTDNGNDEIARGMAEMERKYSVHRPRPEEDMARAAHVGVLDNGFAGEAASALEGLGWTYLSVPMTFDPLQLAEDLEILFVPSGGLYGTSGSADLKERLRAFVEAGGTLIVMAQMLGEDFQTVPTPTGESLQAYGWFEDQSCWVGSLRIAAIHPLTAGLRHDAETLSVDGFLAQWPTQATVLLRKSSGGMPALIAYPLGAGWVVVGTIFEDWGLANGRSSAEGQVLLGNLLRWGVDPSLQRPVCLYGSPCTIQVPVTVQNLTESPANMVVWKVTDNVGYGLLSWTESRQIGPGESFPQNLEISLPDDWATRWREARLGVLDVRYSLRDSSRTIGVDPLRGTNKPWIVQEEARAGQFVAGTWSDAVVHAPQIGLGLSVDSEYGIHNSFVPVHLSVRNFGDAHFSGTVRLSSSGRQFPQVPVEVAAGETGAYDAVVGPVYLSFGHDGLAGGGAIRADVYSASGDGPLTTATKNLLNDPTLVQTTFQSSETTAGAGDELHFFGTFTNQSMGEVTARYRMTFSNYYSSIGAPCPATKTDWHEFHAGHDESFSFDEPYTVPAGCNGVLDASLFLCTPGQLCWDSRDEGNATRRYVTVALPNSQVELDIGDFTVVDGPAFRVPVKVRNVGKRPAEQARVRLMLFTPPGVFPYQPPVDVESNLFDLPRGEEATLQLDLPFTPGPALDKHYIVTASFRDRTVPQWSFDASRDLHYGQAIYQMDTFRAVAGCEAVSGGVDIANLSSVVRHFVATFDQADLAFHERRESDIGPFQRVTVALSVPLPSPHTYGTWPMLVTSSDGALLNEQRTIWLTHDAPYVQISSRAAAPSFRAGETAMINIEVTPTALAQPLPGTLEVTCDKLTFSEIRRVVLSSVLTATESFSIPVPPDVHPGDFSFHARWLGTDGTIAENEGSFAVPQARFEVRSLQVGQLTAGDPISYEVTNVGGSAAGWYVFEWQLRGERGWLTKQARTIPAPLDETGQINFALPPDVASGSYRSDLVYYSDGRRITHSETLEIAGVESGFDVGTGLAVYTLGQPIDGWAEVVNGPLAFPGALLQLKVLGPHLCTAGFAPWGVFQGSSSRQGVVKGGDAMFPPGYPHPCFQTAASLPPGVTAIATAAGDVNEDGADDVVAVWQVGSTASLGIFAGPDLTQYGVVPIPGPASAVALTVADVNGDGHLEIVEVDSGDGSSLAARAFDRTLNPLWETSSALDNGDTPPFPAGGPIAADLAGDGDLALLVPSGHDVHAINGSSGEVRWRMADENPDFSEWVVTGIAAGDPDGDGLAEVAVGFRIPNNPEGGAVALLDGAGVMRWMTPLTHPVAATPIVTREGDIAVVQTPDSSTSSSALTLLDSITGDVVTETTTPFWSRWSPAAADTNDDAASELAVVSGDPACSTCAPRSVLLFDTQGSLLWSAPISGVPTTPPVLLDMNGDSRPDVLVDYLTSQGKDGLVALRGSDGGTIGGGDSSRDPSPQPLLVMDLNGDCTAEFLVGHQVIKGAACIGPSRVTTLGTSAGSSQAMGEVLWRWEGSADLAANEVWDAAQLLSTKQRTGIFYLVGDLKNSLGQIIGHDEAEFSVETGSVMLTFDPLPQACRTGAELQATGSVRNAGSAPLTLDVTLLLDGVELERLPFALGAREEQPYTASLLAPATGVHSVQIKAGTGTTPYQILSQQFWVEEPAAGVSVAGLTRAGQDPFDLTVELANRMHLPLELDVGLDVAEQPPSPRQHVTLAGAAHTTVSFQRQITADTTFIASVSGDVSAEEPFTVHYDVELDPAYMGSSALPIGHGALHFQLANAGGHPWRGDLLWSLTGATNLSGSIATEVAAGSSRNLDAPVTLASGESTLHLEAGGVAREFPVVAYTDGHGALTVLSPSPVVEGDAAVSLRVTNLLATQGTFEVTLEVTDAETGSEMATERRVWSLEGDQTVEETVPLNLGPGSYLLVPRLNEVVTGVGPISLAVVPGYAAELTAGVGPIDEHGTLPLLVTVHNVGARDVTGTLVIEGLGEPLVTPNVSATVGGTAQTHVAIEPDRLPAGDVPVGVSYVTGGGQVLASQQVVVAMQPGIPTIVNAPQAVTATAGSTVPVEFVVQNTGTQTVSFELSLSINGGSVFAGQQGGELPGGQQQVVRFDVPLPADLPSTRMQSEYALVRVDPVAQQGQTVDDGWFVLKVEGVPVIVDAEVDRDHVQPGDTVALTLTLSADALAGSLPLFAHVSYLPFDERRDFELGPAGAQLTFEVPIEQPGGELGYSIHFASGRALYLDALTIHPAGEAVEITALQREYRAGEQIQLAVTLNHPGTFEAYGFEQSASLSVSGSVGFQIPAGLPQGRYPIPWTFYGSGPDVGVVNGEYPVKVRGPLVRITRVHAYHRTDLEGQQASVGADVTSDTFLPINLRAWLVGPSGKATFMGEMPLDLQVGELHKGSLLLDLTDAEAGTQSCVVGVYGQDGTLLADGAAQLDIGGGRVLGVGTDKVFYANAGDTVNALVDVQGLGQGSLTLRLDGEVAIMRSVSLSGLQRVAVLVPGAGAGHHDLEAVLDAQGRTSSASTSFSVGVGLPDLSVDLGGGTTESGTVRVVSRVRNIGQSDAPATELTFWDGEPGTGVLATTLPVGALASGAEAFVPAEITLTEGTHEVTGWVNRSGAIDEFDTSNNVASFEVVVGQTVAPPPTAASVQTMATSYRIGDPVLVQGTAPDGTYCAAVVCNGIWAIGDTAPAGCLSTVTLTSANGAIAPTQIWTAGTVGPYDVLLISGECGSGGTIAAASDPGVTYGFQVMGEAIPLASPLGLLALVALIALLGAWLLIIRRA
jgi:hypothetical protein